LVGAGYDAYVVVGTAPKSITLKDESLMECPFSMDIQDNEDRDDPEVDDDENMMHESEKKGLDIVEGFNVTQLENPKSKFDKDRADSDSEKTK